MKDNNQKIIAGYIRVSTDMQVEKDSLASQRQRIEERAKMIGKSLEIYEDAGVSAATTSRPAFERMMNDIKLGKVDTVIVVSLDRLTRKLKDLIELFDFFKEHNVDFISITQNIDSKTPSGKALLHITGVFAEFERDTTAERVASVMTSRAKDRKWNGGVIPYGFKKKEKSKTIEINETEAVVVRKIFDLYLKFKSHRAVVHHLNSSGYRTRNGCHWSWTSVGRILANPIYYGALTYNKRRSFGKTSKPRPKNEHIITEGVFPPIVTKEVFDEVQLIRKERARIPPRVRNSSYLLTGLLKCGICGGSMFGYTYHDKRKIGRSFRYYKCSSNLQKGKSFCPGNVIRADELERLIYNELKSFVINPLKLKEKVKDFENESVNEKEILTKQLKALEAELEGIDDRKSRLCSLYETGKIEEDLFTKRMSVIEGDKAKIVKTISEIRSKLNQQPNINFSYTLGNIKHLAEVYDELKFEERQELMRTIFSEIRIYKHDIIYDLFLYPDVINYDSSILCNNSEIQHVASFCISKYPEITFSDKLKKYRKMNELKQVDLAKKLGVDEMTIVRWEKGRSFPLEKHRKRIDALLNTIPKKKSRQTQLVSKAN